MQTMAQDGKLFFVSERRVDDMWMTQPCSMQAHDGKLWGRNLQLCAPPMTGLVQLHAPRRPGLCMRAFAVELSLVMRDHVRWYLPLSMRHDETWWAIAIIYIGGESRPLARPIGARRILRPDGRSDDGARARARGTRPGGRS